MSTEWQKLKLSSLGTFDRGKSKHRPRDAAHLYGGPYPFIQTGDVTAAGGRITSFRQTYSEAGLAQSKLWPAGTLCITIAATALLTFPACFPDSVVGFTADETKADVRYIEYVFRAFRDAVKRRAYGSVQENINLEVLRDLEFPIPSLQVQKHIAEFLTHFDDRIALLRETNATLEAIAQALFKSWFVDFDPVHARARGEQPAGLAPEVAALFPDSFEESDLGKIPKGWTIGRVEDLMELAYGKALKATARIDGPIPVYGSGGITGYHNESLVNGPSIIVGRKGTVGSLYWEDLPFFPIDTVFYVKTQKPQTYCFYLLQRLGLKDMNTDAAVPGLNRNNVYRLQVLIPPEEVLAAFDNIASVLRHRIFSNNQQSQTLANLRDTLLPRLISGQLRLPDAEAMVSETQA
ncbi:restriction endonuclease subunit S [Aeromonas dhakensis]|uniref:restriction endonuclease subunit S n=1 Tax=Aeromonas dhakensis TaxID=196024 RepID=UPI003985AB9A